MNTTSDDVAERAAKLFTEGLCCSESVLQAVAESRGVQSDLIPRIATGLCGGIARTAGLWGAVSGGVPAVSLVTGRRQPTEAGAPARGSSQSSRSNATGRAPGTGPNEVPAAGDEPRCPGADRTPAAEAFRNVTTLRTCLRRLSSSDRFSSFGA